MRPDALSIACATALLLATWGLTAGTRTGSSRRFARFSGSRFLLGSTVSGDLLSAATVMGFAGAIMRTGYDALWYPVGFAAGLVVVLPFLVGPLRRDGARSVPDFAARRLDSRAVAALAGAFAVSVGVLHMLPQLKGVGLLLSELLGLPYWAGVLVVGGAIAARAASWPQRDLTLARAARHWLAQVAVALPLFVLAAVSGVGSGASSHATLQALSPAWTLPFGGAASASGEGHSLLQTLSLLLALLCGAAGLPQLLLRSRSTADAREAKRTGLVVIAILSLLLLFPAAWGFLGRAFNPSLYADGATDLVLVRLPQQVLSLAGIPWAGSVLSGVTAAGAFAACTTGFAVLLSAVSGLAVDGIRASRRSGAVPAGGMAQRIAPLAIAATAMALGLTVQRVQISTLVGWAFSVAASTLFPLLVLGVWYRGLTPAGALIGLATGGAGTVGSLAFALLAQAGATPAAPPLLGVLTSQPAIWCVPLTFASMVLGSILTRGTAPADARLRLLRLHAPEQLGL